MLISRLIIFYYLPYICPVLKFNKTAFSSASVLDPLIIINSIVIALFIFAIILLLARRKKSYSGKAKDNEFMKEVFDTVNTGIIILDKKSKSILYANNYVLKLSNYNRSELTGKKIDKIILPEIPYEENSRKKLSEIEGEVITKSGKGIPVLRNINSLTLNNKDYYVESFIDNSAGKQYKKEVEYARDIADKANKLKSEFLANMSHEFRTPMNAIIGISNSILKYDSKGLSKEQVEGISHIKQSGVRLLDLVNDLLDLAKIESGKTTVNFSPFPPDKLITDLKSMVEELIKGKNIRFFVRKNPNVPEIIISDSRKLYQILTNLLSNAVKFTHKGKIQLKIHKLGEKLYFEVEDTGIGIAKENLNLIFDKFAQIESSDQKKYKGTGLGLALCKDLVELLEGEISVESEPGKGTVMKFYILFRTTAETTMEQEDIPAGTVEETNKPDKKRILIIENDRETRYYYNKYLKDDSFQLAFAKDGKEGLKKIFLLLPDIIVLGLKLPGMTGYEILRKIKYSAKTCLIPVIIVTELDNIPGKAIYNYDHVLHKPVDIKDLLSVIIHILSDEDHKKKKKVIIISDNVNELEYMKTSFSTADNVVITIQESKKSVNLINEIEPDTVIYDADNTAINETEFINKFKNSERGEKISPLIIICKSDNIIKTVESDNIKSIIKSADSNKKITNIIHQYSDLQGK